jgi:hypothetical protein
METLSVMDEHWAVEMCASVHALIAWRGRGSAPQPEGWVTQTPALAPASAKAAPRWGCTSGPKGLPDVLAQVHPTKSHARNGLLDEQISSQEDSRSH